MILYDTTSLDISIQRAKEWSRKHDEIIKRAAHRLKDVKYPDCVKICTAIRYLAPGECESVCPFKFNKKEE